MADTRVMVGLRIPNKLLKESAAMKYFEWEGAVTEAVADALQVGMMLAR
ncbi:MAG: hypothetical protein WC749_00235 [Dehalococcoidia bacterium]